MCEHPRKCTLRAFYRNGTPKNDFYTKFLKKYIIDNENTFHKQNLTMNTTAKRNLSFNADIGLWTVNNKLDKIVTLHSDFLEMSYE